MLYRLLIQRRRRRGGRRRRGIGRGGPGRGDGRPAAAAAHARDEIGDGRERLLQRLRHGAACRRDSGGGQYLQARGKRKFSGVQREWDYRVGT